MLTAQLQDWKLFLAPSTCFFHIPAPCWARTTSPLVSMGRGCRCAGRRHPWCIRNPGKVTTSALFGGCRGFALNQPLAPVPGVIAVCVPRTAAWGHRGLPRLRRKLRPGAENKIPFFVGKCSDLKWSDSLISGFESHTLIVCQD